MSDLISRQAAIDAVNDITKWYCKTYHETRPTTIAVIDALKQLPSALPDLEEEDIPMEYFENGGI